MRSWYLKINGEKLKRNRKNLIIYTRLTQFALQTTVLKESVGFFLSVLISALFLSGASSLAKPVQDGFGQTNNLPVNDFRLPDDVNLNNQPVGDSQLGLSEKNVLPTYRTWLEDPEFSELRPDVVTPHTPWARPYAGRGLKLVVIAPRWTQRATIELQQRFDFDAVPVMTLFHHTWSGKDGPHYGWIKYGTREITTARAMTVLRSLSPPDVIVIGWLTCSILPAEVEQAILDNVAAGSGLVIFNPKPLSDNLKSLIKQCEAISAEAVHAVIDGLPTQQLPPLGQTTPRSFIDQGAKFYQGQKGGRIVVVDYAPLPTTRSSNCYFSPPGADMANKGILDIHYDYYCSLAGRVILWAGNNMPQVKLTGWENLSNQIDTQTSPGNLGVLRIDSEYLSEKMTAQLVIRDADSTVEHQSSHLISEDMQISLKFPHLKTGGHYADIILRDRKGRTLDWGTKYFTSTSGVKITSLTTDQKSYKPNQPMPVDITMEGNLTGIKLEVNIFDTHNRLVWAKEVDAQPQVLLQVDVSDVHTVQCQVRVILSQADQMLAKHTIKVLIRQPQPLADQYQYGAWASTNASFVRRQSAQILAEQGVRTGILGGDMDDWAELNVMSGPYITRYLSLNDTSQRGLMVRKPCLTDPEYLKQEEEKLRGKTEYYKHYSPPAYSLGDDQGMMREPQDGCVSPTCLVAFRKYLNEKYGDLKTLNTSWGTHYFSFDEAMPLSLPDAITSKQYPRWADHRLYMDQLFVQMHSDSKAIVRDVDPEARVGFEGPLADNSWIGFEWKKLMDVVDQMAPYPNAWKWDIVRSFARPNLFFGGWYGAYPMYRYPDDRRFYPWYMLFQGANIYYFFATYGWSEAGDQSMGMAPDLRSLPCLSETSASVKRIQQGIDRLVLGAQRQTDGIAVMFSRPSQHAAMITPPIPTRDFDTDAGWTTYLATHDHTWSLNTEANLRLLDDMGLSYVFVDHTDIAAGKLQEGNFKMLVMPFGHALSVKEEKAIKEFVIAGGTVLADVQPAIFDLHSKPLNKGLLDDVFGVKRTGFSFGKPLRDEMINLADLTQHKSLPDATKKKDQGDPWGIPVDEILQFTVAGKKYDVGERVPMPVDTTVTTLGGKASARTDAGTPVFITNTYGKGHACLMNMAIQHYLTLRAAGRNLGMQDILKRFLTDADIEPKIKVLPIGRHAARVRVFSFQDGQSRLVALLRSHKRLHDEPAAFADRAPHSFVVKFPESGHIYDVINRQYHGYADSLDLEIPVATPFLLASLPYKVTSLNCDIRQNHRTVTIDTSVMVSDGKPGRHIIYIRVTDSKNKRRPEYDLDIIATDGRGSYTFNLAMNDPKGKWTIHLEDVASGTTHKQDILIQPLMAQEYPSINSL